MEKNMGNNEKNVINLKVGEVSEAEKVLGTMPSFDEHKKKRTKADRVQRFVDLAMGMTNNKGKNVGNVLEEMTPEAALKFLQHINGQLCNNKITGKSEIYGSDTHRIGVYSEMVVSGGVKEFLAPEPSLQKELFEEYFDAIKKVGDKDRKALLA